MTFAIFIIIFLALFLAVLNFLPTADAISPQIADSIEMVVGFMLSWNFIFPINELLFCVGLIILVEFSIWIWKAFKWLLHIIRGGN